MIQIVECELHFLHFGFITDSFCEVSGLDYFANCLSQVEFNLLLFWLVRIGENWRDVILLDKAVREAGRDGLASLVAIAPRDPSNIRSLLYHTIGPNIYAIL